MSVPGLRHMLAAAVLGIGALGATAAPAQTVVKYGYIAPVAYYWDVFAAVAKGFDKEEGIVIEPLRIDSASQSVQTLLSGAVDVLSTPIELAVSAREKGGDVTLLGAQTARPAFALVSSPDVKRFEDLRGKSIGVTQVNEAVSTMLALLLEKHGVQRGEYQFIALGGGPTRYAALQRGAIAATALSQPQDFRAAKDGLNVLGYTYEAFDGAYIGLTARGNWLKAHEADTVKFLRAVVRGGRWVRDPAHRDEAIAILRKAIGGDADDATKTFDLYYGEQGIMARDLALGDQDIQRYLTLRGSKDSPDRYIDRRYIDQAVQATK
ncbi:ABC transporter substrate-binding protein [Achromobacter marplatensis]|uniref:ABC transporter substrate-binding protein n=1 Tax=Achromobacter marplatensis TaxID=470868 RepID=UPI0028EFBC3D|nr:ABC transporter substrate-binding protein [Achromobacter marplatensis]